jgi:hypothetical protein
MCGLPVSSCQANHGTTTPRSSRARLRMRRGIGVISRMGDSRRAFLLPINSLSFIVVLPLRIPFSS